MQRLKDKASSYIKNNWGFILVMLLGSIAIFIQMDQVVLYADDYSLGIHSPGGIGAAFSYLAEHYMTWGGGYTSFIVIVLLMFPDFVWKLFLAGIVILFIGLSVKMICKNHQSLKWLVALTLWACFFALSIWISRESIYWLDGGAAYLFSMFQAFLLFYFAYTRLVQKVTHKYDCVLFPLVALFAGWSSAQSGLIAVLAILLIILWVRFIKKESIRKSYYFYLALSIIGYLIFYFAPGNSGRMDTFTEYASYGIFQKIGYRADSVFDLIFANNNVEFSAAPLFVYLAIGLVALLDLCTVKRETHPKIKITRLICSIYSLSFVFLFMLSVLNIPGISSSLKGLFEYKNLLHAHQSGGLSPLLIAPYILSSLVILSSLISAFFYGKRSGNPFLFTVLVMAYVAELCMVMAPYSPLRTTLYTIAFAWVAIGYLVVTSVSQKVKILPLGIIIFAIFNIYLGIFAIILHLLSSTICEKNRRLSAPLISATLFSCIIAVIGAANYYTVTLNYHRNKVINAENISRLANYEDFITEQSSSEGSKTANKDRVIYLTPPQNEIYGFTGLAGVDWVEKAVKKYYQIPEDIHLVYEGDLQNGQ